MINSKMVRNTGAIIAGITITASALTIGMDKMPAEALSESSPSVPSWTAVATTSPAGQGSATPDWTGYLYGLSHLRNYGELIYGNTVYLPSKAVELKAAANAVCADMRSGKSSVETANDMWLETSNNQAEASAVVVASQVYVCPDMRNN